MKTSSVLLLAALVAFSLAPVASFSAEPAKTGGAFPGAPPLSVAKDKGKAEAKVDPAENAKKSGKVVIADFTLGGICKMCIEQKAVLDEVLPAYGDQVVLQFVHVGKEASTVDRYNVSTIPALLFFDKTGKLVGRFDAVVTPASKIEKQLSSMGVSKK